MNFLKFYSGYSSMNWSTEYFYLLETLKHKSQQAQICFKSVLYEMKNKKRY